MVKNESDLNLKNKMIVINFLFIKNNLKKSEFFPVKVPPG